MAAATAAVTARVAVAEDHRPESEQVVDVLVPVDICDARAGAVRDEGRVRLPAELHRAGTAARPAGNDSAGTVEQRPGPAEVPL